MCVWKANSRCSTSAISTSEVKREDDWKLQLCQKTPTLPHLHNAPKTWC